MGARADGARRDNREREEGEFALGSSTTERYDPGASNLLDRWNRHRHWWDARLEKGARSLLQNGGWPYRAGSGTRVRDGGGALSGLPQRGGGLSSTSLVVMVLATLMPSLGARADTVTVCDQKVDYQPAASDPAAPGRDLRGLWVGEILGTNVAYSVDYVRCWGLAIERVDADGKVAAKLILATSTKNLHQGASYGTKGSVTPWTGQLGDNGATLRFVSRSGNSDYTLRLTGPAKMEGRMTLDSGHGRLSLAKK